MNYSIIDTHTHCYFPKFTSGFKDIMMRAKKAGVKHQVQIGCDEISSIAALKMSQENPGFFATLGLHPCDVQNVGIKNSEYHRYSGTEDYQLKAKNFTELFALFAEIFQENSEKIVAFGETGFDLYHENSDHIFQLQTQSFIHHLQLCEKFNRPFILHSRNATAQTIEFLRQQKIVQRKIRGIWHCFCEDTQTAQIATQEFGLKLGIGGVLTYNNTDALAQAVADTPIEFLVTETDSPFLMPRKAKNRKAEKFNTPEFLPEIIQKIAEIKKIDEQECTDILYKNGCKIFNI